MSEITAIVKRLEDDFAWVETNPATSCSRCKGGNGCSSVSISRLFCSSKQQFKVINHLPLSVGDVVNIKLEDEVMIKTAVLSYGIPLAALVSGALLGGWLWPEASDIASISVGGAAFILGLLSLRFLVSARLKEDVYPTVLNKVSGPVIAVQSS